MEKKLRSDKYTLWDVPEDAAISIITSDSNGKYPSLETIILRYLDFVKKVTICKMLADQNKIEEYFDQYIEHYNYMQFNIKVSNYDFINTKTAFYIK